MARRFRSEASPLLSRLLISGTAHRPSLLTSTPSHNQSLAHIGSATSSSGGWAPSGLLLSSSEGTKSGITSGRGREWAADGRDRRDAEGQGGDLAPGALVRVRVGVLQCLGCVCGSPEARGAAKGMAWGIAEACLPFLSTSHPPPLQQAASNALKAVAQADEDAVWLLLTDVVCNSSSNSSSSSSNMPGTHAPKSALQSSGPCITALPEETQSHGPLPAQQQQQQPAEQPYNTDTGAGPATPNLLVHGVPPPPPSPSFPPFRALLSPLSQQPGSHTLASKPSRSSHPARARSSSSGPPLPPSFSLASPSAPWVVTSALASECAPRARTLLAGLENAGSAWNVQESAGLDPAGGTEGVEGQAGRLHVPLPTPLAVLVGGPLG